MTDRPLERAVEGLRSARDDGARGVADVADQAKKATDEVASLVEAVNIRDSAADPAADIADLGQAIQAVLARLGDEVGAILTGAINELDALSESPVPPETDSAHTTFTDAAAKLSVIKVSTGSAARHPALRHPPPLSRIDVDETVRYTTDERGRVTRVRTVLTATKPDQPRDAYAQRTTQDKLPGDHAGHLIARILGGLGQHLNLVPMEGRFINLGQYATLEHEWKEAVETTKEVELDIRLEYNDDTRRPYKLVISHTIDGETTKTTIRNKPARKRSS